MIQILTEPKNALVKQYRRLFELEEVKLEFSEEALKAIAKLALERELGAPGSALNSRRDDARPDVRHTLRGRYQRGPH